MSAGTFTESLAHWAHSLDFRRLPDSAVEAVRKSLIDTCGVLLAGAAHPYGRIVRDVAARESSGACRVLGSHLALGVAQAARCNAFAAHVLDFDDTCYEAGVIHPGAVLFPVVLALGESLAVSGSQVMTAFVAGLEVAGRIGLAAKELFRKGWFTTSVFGVAGAAAAAAKMLGLPPAHIQYALALALSQAGGVRQNNGTSGKPFAVGRAAENGVLCAQLAQAGLMASEAILEGQEGFFDVYCDGRFDAEALRHPGEPLVVLDPGISHKSYPCCSSAHAAMDAVRRLMNEHGLAWSQVRAVTCALSPSALRFLAHDEPRSAEQLLFSLPFCLACVLRDGTLSPDHLSEKCLNDPQVRELMSRVAKRGVTVFDGHGRSEADCPEGAEVVLETRDGRSFSLFVGEARGSVSQPFSREDIEEKFRMCARQVLASERAESCLELMRRVEHVDDIRKLTAAMVP